MLQFEVARHLAETTRGFSSDSALSTTFPYNTFRREVRKAVGKTIPWPVPALGEADPVMAFCFEQLL